MKDNVDACVGEFLHICRNNSYNELLYMYYSYSSPYHYLTIKLLQYLQYILELAKLIQQ